MAKDAAARPYPHPWTESRDGKGGHFPARRGGLAAAVPERAVRGRASPKRPEPGPATAAAEPRGDAVAAGRQARRAAGDLRAYRDGARGPSRARRVAVAGGAP